MFIYLAILFINASTLFHLDQEEIFNKAEYIVTAKVDSIECQIEETSTNGRLPFSYITLKITDIHYSVDGQLLDNEDIVIRQVSCKNFEDIDLNIEGLAVFEKGTKVFVSLNRVKNPNYDNYFYVTASEQGKLTYDSKETLYSTSTATYVRKGSEGRIDYMSGDKGMKFKSLKDILEKIKKVKGV